MEKRASDKTQYIYKCNCNNKSVFKVVCFQYIRELYHCHNDNRKEEMIKFAFLDLSFFDCI